MSESLRDIDDVGMCPKCFTRNTDDTFVYSATTDEIVAVKCVCNECGHEYEEDVEQYMEYA